MYPLYRLFIWVIFLQSNFSLFLYVQIVAHQKIALYCRTISTLVLSAAVHGIAKFRNGPIFMYH